MKSMQYVYDNSIPEPNTGCWLWTGYLNKKGYGQVRLEKKMISSHRFSWEKAKGKIDDNYDDYHGVCVLHKCDTPSCVNPDHLFLGTNKNNIDDMKNKKRQRCGEKVHNHKLTSQDVSDIKSLIEKKITQKNISEKYGVSRQLISRIKCGLAWNFLSGVEQ